MDDYSDLIAKVHASFLVPTSVIGGTSFTFNTADIRAMADALEAQAAEIERLTKALRPFAGVAGLMMPLGAERWRSDKPGKEFVPGGWPMWGDYFAAYKALTPDQPLRIPLEFDEPMLPKDVDHE